MYTIKEIKLLDRGLNGAEIKFDEKCQKSMATIIDKVSKKRRLPISFLMRSKINLLKYYFLILSDHWNQDWEKYLKDDYSAPKSYNTDENINFDSWEYSKVQRLFSSIYITNIAIKDDGFELKGEFETEVKSKSYSISLPIITSSDNFEYFDEVIDIIISIKEATRDYLEDDNFIKKESKSLLIEKANDDKDEIERINSLTDDEAMREHLQRMAKSGAIILLEDLAKEIDIEEKKNLEEEPESSSEEVLKESILINEHDNEGDW